MKVFLIGAGPGDPGLLTLKGRDALAAADVVVYDALANDSLLSHARPDAEKIYVGKVAGNHALPQDQINALLVDKAKEGNVRSGPTTKDAVVGKSVRDVIFVKVEQKGDWVKVSHPDLTGWEHKDLVWP